MEALIVISTVATFVGLLAVAFLVGRYYEVCKMEEELMRITRRVAKCPTCGHLETFQGEGGKP